MSGVSEASGTLDLRECRAFRGQPALKVVTLGGGLAPMHPGWANNGGDIAPFYRLANLSRRLVPQLVAASLVFGGVLERYPKLAVIVAELKID